MAKTPSKPSNENTHSAKNSARTSGTRGKSAANSNGTGGQNGGNSLEMFSLAARKIQADSRSLRDLEDFAHVPKTVLGRIRLQPGYQPSAANESKLEAVGLVIPNEFRRYEQPETDDEPESNVVKDDAFMYGAKVARSRLRQAIVLALDCVTEADHVWGSDDWAETRAKVLDGVAHFKHPGEDNLWAESGCDAQTAKGDDLLGRHRAAELAGDNTVAAEIWAEFEAFTKSPDHAATTSRWFEALQAWQTKTYGFASSTGDRVTVEFLEKLLPPAQVSGSFAQFVRHVDELGALRDRVSAHCEKVPQQTRVHLQLQQLVESISKELVQLRREKYVDFDKCRPWQMFQQELGTALTKHAELRACVMKALRPDPLIEDLAKALGAMR